MVQFGGHHLAINVTIVGSACAHAEPHRRAAGDLHAERPVDPPARQRERQGVALINALEPAPQKQAILNYDVKATRARPRHSMAR